MRGAAAEAFADGVTVSVRNGFSIRATLEASGYSYNGRGRVWVRICSTLEEAETEQARLRDLIAEGGVLHAG